MAGEEAAVLCLFSYQPTDTGHGATRRSSQFLEVLDRSGVRFELLQQPPWSDSRLRRAVRGVWRTARYGPHPYGYTPGGLALLGARSEEQYLTLYRKYPAARVVLVDTPYYTPTAIRAAKSAGLNCIALLINFESLWLGRDNLWPRRRTLNAFGYEWAALAEAGSVVCISYEEMWLARGLGLDADFLPYCLPDAWAARPTAVRAARERRTGPPSDTVLVLGTAANPPTLDGMLELINTHLADPRMENSGLRFEVAGYGTETLRGKVRAANVRIHGTVSEDQLQELQTAARYLLVYQRYGMGGLTRLAESLAAGIPVVASPVACRSHFGVPGVYVFNDAGELAELSARELPMPPVPPRPEAAERRFVERVRRAAGRPSGAEE